jgi:hypothetical protein
VRSHLRWLELLWPSRYSPRRDAVSLTDAVLPRQPYERTAFFEWAERSGLAGSGEDRAAAHARGLKLLREHLSPAQLAEFDECGYFEVTGGQTGRRYRIRSGTQMNIERLGKRGKIVHGLCFVPDGNLVAGDVMLAQKLALELFEMDALRVANKFCAG